MPDIGHSRLKIGHVAFVLASSAALVFSAAPSATACSCAGFSDEQALAGNAVAFIGEVADYEESSRVVTWTFDVSAVYKGEVMKAQEVVSTPGGMCGLGIPRSGEFLVFAEDRTYPRSPEPGPGQYLAHLCGGTRPAADAPVPASFGAPTQPRPTVTPSNDADRTVAVVAATVAIAAVAASLLRWGRAGTSRSSPRAS